MEARRSIQAILDAAVRVLSERSDASLKDIANAAGVTRQTIYAHFPSREELVNAAIDRVSQDAVAAMDKASLDDGPPIPALLTFMRIGWQTFVDYPRLLGLADADPDADQLRHQPIRERLERLVVRGQVAGDFDSDLPPGWLTTTVMALGHAAGEEITAGRMTPEEATAALEQSVLHLLGAHADAQRGG